MTSLVFDLASCVCVCDTAELSNVFSAPSQQTKTTSCHILPYMLQFRHYCFCLLFIYCVCPERATTHLLLSFRGLFIQIEGLKIEGVVCYEAPWDNVMI